MPAGFERQISVLLDSGYPAAAGLDPAAFLAHMEPLAEKARGLAEETVNGSVPFVLVVSQALITAATAIELVRRRGEAGVSVLEADDLARFVPIDGLSVPAVPAYLIVDVETGAETRNVTPQAALETIESQGRSPLTIEEGIALVTQFPETVAKNAGFSLLGSRCGDRRVTALWISQGRPKLGWCWAGNPHTWLGSASCAGRIAAEPSGVRAILAGRPDRSRALRGDGRMR